MIYKICGFENCCQGYHIHYKCEIARGNRKLTAISLPFSVAGQVHYTKKKRNPDHGTVYAQISIYESHSIAVYFPVHFLPSLTEFLEVVLKTSA
jgi:hypothetical protein